MSTSSLPPDAAPWLASLSEASLRLKGQGVDALEASAPDGSCTVVFDGVLYNRSELIARFANCLPAATDAGLVLQAYRSWGEDVLRRIKGIFAVLIWDRARNILLCARDPLGVYPLFYVDAGRELLFSTSIERLLQHTRVSGALNRAVLAGHLCHHWPTLEETYFEAVRRVPPGHAMRVAGADRQLYRYWDPSPPGPPVNRIGEDELERFDELLAQAVGRCLDMGPAGICLSGGLDSVSVATVAADNSRRRGQPSPLALSIVFPDPAFDEEVLQRSVAAELGLRQVLLPFTELVGRDGVLMSALEMSSGWPWPLTHPSNVPFYNLGLEGKRRGCQVILTGEGGDEWLAVSPFYAADLLRSLRIRELYRLGAVIQRSYPLSVLATVRVMVWHCGARSVLAGAAREVLRQAAPGALAARWRRRFRQSTPAWVAPDPSLRHEMDQRVERSIEASLQELKSDKFYLRVIRPLLGTEGEHAFESGRRRGLRVLHPLWDADLVDFLYRTPPPLLSRDGLTKGLVRGMLARRFPGLGFGQQKKTSPTRFYVDVLLREGLPAWRKMSGTSFLSKLGIVDGSALDSTMAAILSASKPQEFYRIWDVLNLEAWVRSRV
jgi:asparagine synthase (glutamine-hydrolysing)